MTQVLSSLMVSGIYLWQSCASLTVVVGLAIEGASWVNDKLVLNEGERNRFNPSQIRWVQAEETSQSYVNLPVYLNGDRSDVLFTVDLPFDDTPSALVAMRAVCLTAGA